MGDKNNRPTFETIVKKLSEYQKKLQTLYGDHAFELQHDDSDDESDDSDDDDDAYLGGQNEFAVFKMERMDKLQRKVDHFWKALLDEGKSLRSIHAAILAAADKVMQLKQSNNGIIPSKSCVESGQQQQQGGEEEDEVESKHLLTDDAYVSFDTGHQPTNVAVVEDATVEGYYTVDGGRFSGGNVGQDSTTTLTSTTAVGCSDTYVEINIS